MPSFYADFAPYYESIFPFSETVYAFLRRYLMLGRPRCLDVGCGPGHYCGRLAGDGFSATGIDLDAAMIEQARLHYPQATFHCMDMRDVAQLGAVTTGEGAMLYDAIFCIGNTAAHLTRSQFAAFVSAMRQLLCSDGLWILQIMNWDYVLTQPEVNFPVIQTNAGAVFHRRYTAISEAEVAFQTRLEVRGRRVFEEALPLYPLRSNACTDLHAQYGFKCEEHFGSYRGDPFDPGVFSPDLYVFKQASRKKADSV
ncbi:MAG: class I SAM-dependent methyltransferase [Anaerolineae bacterium]|nr:class I SAM-dependent methyltransferase [Anaerolineae bacterium]